MEAPMFDKLIHSKLKINDKVVNFIPNTLRFRDGVGQPEVEVERNGDIVLREDAHTKFSHVIFSIRPTPSNMKKFLNFLKSNQRGHVISISSQHLDCVICEAVMTNEIALDNDDIIDIEFRGLPVMS